MLYVIHGDDTQESLKKRDEVLLLAKTTLRFDGEKSQFLEIKNSFDSQELFSDKKNILIENFTKIKAAELEELFILCNKATTRGDTHVVLFHTSVLDKKYLTKLKEGSVFLYALPKYFFTFLDGFLPNNGKKQHMLLEELLKYYAGEQLYYALVKRVRQLLIIKSGNAGEFSDFKHMGEWQLSKLKNQARLWKEEQLIAFYQKLFDLEVGMKTSQLPLQLAAHLDILLVSEL